MQLVAKMIGKEYADLNQRFVNEEAAKTEKETLLSLKDASGAGTIDSISLDVHSGEVLGLSGLLGSGRSEIVRLIFSVDRLSGGEMALQGEPIHNRSPLGAIRKGFSFCPENRKTEGIIGDLSIRDNIILALQAKRGMFKAISKAEAQKLADEYIEKLEIKTPSADQLIKNLSGGNQQKVILARWLATNPDLLMLDEPTRGIDIGTKAEIQKLVVQLAEQGMAVIFISSEIDEMLRCCDRMVVLRDKKKVAELNGQEISEAAIMHYIAGGAENEPA